MVIVLLTCSVGSVRAYENSEYGFSISFPSGWEETPSSDVVVLYTNDDGSASVNVIVEDTTLPLADYTVESKAQLENLDYYELISERNRAIGGLNAYELVFAWTLFTDNETYYDLQDKQVFLIQNGKAYVITCGADYGVYDSFVPTFDQTLDTFRLASSASLGISNLTLILIVAVIAAVIVLAIGIVFWKRRRKPKQQQIETTGASVTYPPPPPPPPPP